jgi:hypothetical protein
MESQTQGTNINHINNKDKQQTEHKELLSPIKSRGEKNGKPNTGYKHKSHQQQRQTTNRT